MKSRAGFFSCLNWHDLYKICVECISLSKQKGSHYKGGFILCCLFSHWKLGKISILTSMLFERVAQPPPSHNVIIQRTMYICFTDTSTSC